MSKIYKLVISLFIFIFTFYFILNTSLAISSKINNTSPENSYIYQLIICVCLLCSIVATCSFLIIIKLDKINEDK